jgi:hypothetical protein
VPEGILLDNDVVLKACAYRLHAETLAAMTRGEAVPSILAIARFTIRSRLARPGRLVDHDGAARAFEEFLAIVGLIEPTTEEINLAAELEELATARGLEFDTGESQLVAIMVSRRAEMLVTGDKRAVAAMAGIGLGEAEGRIVCFEQLIASLLASVPHDRVRALVCAEPETDRAVTACFGCAAVGVAEADILAGLASYARHLRRGTGAMLAPDPDLLRSIVA